MTPAQLLRALTARAPHTPSWPTDPHERLRAVEQAADDHPGDPTWTHLVLASHHLAHADVPLPAGLRRETLVRADAISATWTAVDAEGERFLVRAPHAGAPPTMRRILHRDRVALGSLVPGLHVRDDALVAPAPGQPLQGSVAPPGRPPAWLAQALIALQGWQAAGLAPPDPHAEELRVVGQTGESLLLVSLTPGPPDPAPVVRRLATELVADGALGRFLDGLRSMPVGSAAELADLLRAALADDLSARATELRRRSLVGGHRQRRSRLVAAIDALTHHVRPPAGRGAVGFDLDGQATVVECDGRIVRWGPDAGSEVVWDATGFRPQVARRLLRACASAPTNPALQRQTGGSAAYTDAMGRWVAAGLKLRTTRLLLGDG